MTRGHAGFYPVCGGGGEGSQALESRCFWVLGQAYGTVLSTQPETLGGSRWCSKHEGPYRPPPAWETCMERLPPGLGPWEVNAWMAHFCLFAFQIKYL